MVMPGLKHKLIVAMMMTSLSLWNVPAIAMAFYPATGHIGSGARDHSCCPGGVKAAMLVKPASSTLPQRNEHPCCSMRGPENPPSLPATSRTLLPQGDGALHEALAAPSSSPAVALAAPGGGSFRQPFLSSTVLRI